MTIDARSRLSHHMVVLFDNMIRRYPILDVDRQIREESGVSRCGESVPRETSQCMARFSHGT